MFLWFFCLSKKMGEGLGCVLMPCGNEYKKKEVLRNFLLEVSSGVEPLYTVLQTVT